MHIIENPLISDWNALLTRPQISLEFLESSVRNIMNRVQLGGDKAVAELTLEYDQASINTPLLSEELWSQLAAETPEELRKAIDQAAANIRAFHETQQRTSEKITTMPGVTCWRVAHPIEKVGIYIPGGSAPLFSTVLMLAIPAAIAGCTNVILATPPTKSGTIDPSILYAAKITGVTHVYMAGGAQAIAALAFGTESITSVDKIFGPGNQYVTKAKQLANQYGVAIDLPAGPSEVLVYADETATPEFVAADLLSQAEHGPDSQVILVTTSTQVMHAVQVALNSQLATLPRKSIAEKAIQNSHGIIFSNPALAVDFINSYAPEHLILNIHQPASILPQIRNAGSIFLGNLTPEAAGDYASGTNHTLPTNGFARAYSGVSLESFLRYITVQEISIEGVQNLGPVVTTMAQAEGLEGHARAMQLRLNLVNAN